MERWRTGVQIPPPPPKNRPQLETVGVFYCLLVRISAEIWGFLRIFTKTKRRLFFKHSGFFLSLLGNILRILPRTKIGSPVVQKFGLFKIKDLQPDFASSLIVSLVGESTRRAVGMFSEF